MSTQLTQYELFWLLERSRQLFKTRDVEKLFTAMTDAFIEAVRADRGTLWLWVDPTGDPLEKNYRNAFKTDIKMPPLTDDQRKLAERACKLGRILTFEEKSNRENSGKMSQTAIAVPLATDNAWICVVLLVRDQGEIKSYTQTDTRILELAAEQASVALDNARLFERANHDPLTGLPNSSYFLDNLNRHMKDVTTTTDIGVLLLDIDTFKRVNRAAGAIAGDRALIDVALTIRDVAKVDGLVARFGSDKFAILLPPDKSIQMALRLRDVAERVRAAMAVKAYHGIKMSVSIGGTSYPPGQEKTAADFVAVVDDLLSKARTRGPGSVEIN